MKVAVVGGGAAGLFSAITAKERYPDATVTVLEKSAEVLGKVRISGGGRCNVTNACPSIKRLSEAYPRGGKVLKKAFQVFNNKHAIQWFESRGVPLVVQGDNRVFPASQSSGSIIDCFLRRTEELGIEIRTKMGVRSIRRIGDTLQLDLLDGEPPARAYDKVIVATGGSPKRQGLEWIEELGHRIEDPVPSLFTFNMPEESITELMGIAVEKTLVRLQGVKLKSEGSLLITHWGMSGPAILNLSAYGARLLSERGYEFDLQVNWIGINNNDVVLEELIGVVDRHPGKVLSSIRPYSLPDRLWRFLIGKCDLPVRKKWGELGKKGTHKLMNVLTNDIYSVNGKTTFREEFVTCGGVSLKSVDPDTLESRVCKDLYFAGEILDIDGITGGYNLQAAWTTAFVAGQLK